MSMIGWVWVATAGATGLDEVVESWSVVRQGLDGSDGMDRATGVALDSAGNVLVVGYLDGAENHGTDGLLAQYGADGVLTWEILQDSGEIGVDRATSDDRLYSVALSTADEVTTCGRIGAEDLDDPPGRYLVQAWTSPLGAAPTLVWDITNTDSTSSPDQDCFGVATHSGLVYAAGWAFHNEDDAGRWLSYKFDAGTGLIQGFLTNDFSGFEAVPDQAQSMAVGTASGEFAIAGVRGVAGAVGGALNDADWHVRYYDAANALQWEHTVDGGRLLEDGASAVAIDVLTQDVFVAGWVNAGTDNLAGADDDWMVVRYDKDQDETSGEPVIVWQTTWESAPLASERATAITLDAEGDVLVAGTAIDPVTGVAVWRVAELSGYDGDLIDEWIALPRAADSVPYGIAYQSGFIALVGMVNDGPNEDFAITTFETDVDYDGVADSIDACPDDPAKAADAGVCGCGVLDVDTDEDGVENCIDDCPDDGGKTEPGVCGCGEPDLDDDLDGTPNCDDDCPEDPNKVEWGECGCGAPDNDSDGDGILGCRDACSNTPEGTPVDEFGCPVATETGDTGAAGGGDSEEVKDNSCGCESSGGPGLTVGALGGLLALALRRRRPL